MAKCLLKGYATKHKKAFGQTVSGIELLCCIERGSSKCCGTSEIVTKCVTDPPR